MTENITQNAITRRPHWGAILISGPQAEPFLQGQLTCDVKKCPTLGGYCNLQGRLISLFNLINSPLPDKPGYILECPLDILNSTLNTLKKYAVFSKVEIQDISESIGISNTEEPEYWQTLDIVSKIPQLTPKTQGAFLPHHVNLPDLGGVSFDKGCYLGQEIIARMHYRSKIKKHLAVFSCEPTDFIPEPGDNIYSSTIAHNVHDPIGHIVNISRADDTAVFLILASLLDEHLHNVLYVTSPGAYEGTKSHLVLKGYP